ncbi:MAG: AAA family ATPase, partial [Oscillospiraceae bacterium]|nr:AAA family ATPase [Oscillospiraceae bacterium]
MLLQFKFSNYRSFAEETVFDMTATSIREHQKSLIEQNGIQMLPVAAFYGANASGKTSFFMAFDAMCRLVSGASARETDEQSILEAHSNPFIFDRNYSDKPTEYEVCLAINGFEYRYGFAHKEKRVLCEYLYKRKLSKNKTIEKTIFERIGRKVVSEFNASIK